MREEREPLGSNIASAIKYMETQLERNEAVLNDSWLRFVRCFPVFLGRRIALYSGLIAGIILAAIVSSQLKAAPFDERMFLFLILLFVFFILFNKLFLRNLKDFLISFDEYNKLNPLLKTLKELYKYDQFMDIGFQLDGQGKFNEAILKAMIKKRKKEIRKKA